VELLTSYSHTRRLADLRRCILTPPRTTFAAAPPASKRPWSLRDRLDERTRADLIDAYLAGATASSLAVRHGLSLRSVKRLLAAEGVRRTQIPARRQRQPAQGSAI
jgi:hypothetical protein